MSTAQQLSDIRKQMQAALAQKPKNIAEYKRLAAEHRRVLHAASPTIKAQWEACHDRGAVR